MIDIRNDSFFSLKFQSVDYISEVREMLDKADGVIMKSNLDYITKFSTERGNIRKFDDVAHFKNVTRLAISMTNASDIIYLQNPHKDNTFVFFGNLPDRPVVSNVLTDDFKAAMESIGISEIMRQRRNIVFHSWRHFYATTISTELSEKHAQLTLGHLTEAMTKHYADHKIEEALLAVCDASNDIFTSMLG